MKALIQFVGVAAFVFIADFIWLGILMKGFYQKELAGLMRMGDQGFAPRLLPALIVYLLIPAGIVLFVGPRATGRSLVTAAGWGALFGFVVYGIYDFSNLAVLEKWNWRVTAADVLWGMTLCGTSAICLKLIQNLTDKAAA